VVRAYRFPWIAYFEDTEISRRLSISLFGISLGGCYLFDTFVLFTCSFVRFLAAPRLTKDYPALTRLFETNEDYLLVIISYSWSWRLRFGFIAVLKLVYVKESAYLMSSVLLLTWVCFFDFFSSAFDWLGKRRAYNLFY